MTSSPSRQAFSLAEVLISTAVLALAIMALFLVLTYSLRAVQVSSRQAEAMHHARRLIDLIRVRNLAFASFPAAPTEASGVNDASDARPRRAAAPFESDLPAGEGFRRNLACERVGNDTSTYEYELMKITVTIFYTEGGHERQVAMQAVQARP